MLLSGAPGSGKTHVAFELARAVATGGKAFDVFKALPGPVAIVEEEHHPGNLAARLKRVLAGVDNPPVYIMHRQKVKLTDPGWVMHLGVQLALLKAGLCILDPFADLHDCDEDKAQEIGPVIEALRLLQEAAPQCVFLVIHHTTKASWGGGKGGMADARGSGRIAGAFDVIYTVRGATRLPGEDVAIRLTCNKNKESQALPECKLSLSLNGHTKWAHSPWEDSKATAVVEVVGLRERVVEAFAEHGEFESFQALVDHVKGRRNTVHDIVEDFVKSGHVAKIATSGRQYRLEWREPNQT